MNNSARQIINCSKPFRHICSALIGVFTLTAYALAASQQGGVSPEAEQDQTNPSAPAETVAENSVLPSTLVYYIHSQNYLQPDWSQDEIASPLLPLAKTDGLDEYQRFFLAQLNYMSFEAQAAYDLFEEFLDRDDWYGWMARQRYAIMDTRAFENFKRLEHGVKYERENFLFDPEFASITGVGERSLCSHWADQGKHKRVVNLAIETLTKTPRDAAYGTLYLAGACFKSFQETGREQEAFSLAQSIRDDLTKTLETRKTASDQHPAYDPNLFDNFIDDRWYGRSQHAPYNYINYEIENLIDWYDQFLACRRDENADACPQR